MNLPLGLRQQCRFLAALLALLGSASATLAQDSVPAVGADALPADDDVLQLDDFIITAVSAPGTTTKMRSSVSVSTLSSESIDVSVPRFTSELFRSLPGLRSEATAGDANTNLTARGLPLSTGGSQYVQLQEDGAPVLQFGDIAFATADTLLRADRSVAAVEFVRGGSASTYASSAPGGVINLISKIGDIAGGGLSVTHGLDFNQTRIDLDYGSPINDDLLFHVGGYFRTGEGSRRTGFNGIDGGQLKLNATRKFAAGYVRFYAKLLDDRAPTYMPMPTRVTGTNSDPHYTSLPGYDILRDTQYTPYLRRDLTLSAEGNRTVSDVTSGVHARSVSLGAEANFDFGDGWNLSNRLNVARNRGRFIAPFPADVKPAADLATELGGAGATLWYATGPEAGQPITAPASLNGNGLLTRIHLFNTSLNDMGNASNHLKVNKRFALPNGGDLLLGLGHFLARQSIDQDWNWNSYLIDVRRDARLIDVRDASGALVTERGQIAYGVPAWGWFARKYDLDYDIDAPFASIGYSDDRWNIDVSARRDAGEVNGAKYDSTPTRAAVDMNGDGQISAVEALGVQAIDVTKPAPIVNYDYHYTSYSAGVNYAFSRELSAFARYSKGFSVRADRLLDAGNVQPDGSIPENGVAFNTAKQTELGLKYRPRQLVPGNLAFFVTLFHAETDEANSEAAKGGPPLILRSYDATGVEFESAYSYGGFDLRATFTVTDAEITAANDPTVVGHRPRRQADLIYSVTPTYTHGRFTVGASFIGTTKSYAQDNNELVMPGYTYVNGFVTVMLAEGLSLGVNVNNAFDEVGISEVEEGSLPGNQIVRARGIPGRTTSLTLNYSF